MFELVTNDPDSGVIEGQRGLQEVAGLQDSSTNADQHVQQEAAIIRHVLYLIIQIICK